MGKLKVCVLAKVGVVGSYKGRDGLNDEEEDAVDERKREGRGRGGP